MKMERNVGYNVIKEAASNHLSGWLSSEYMESLLRRRHVNTIHIIN